MKHMILSIKFEEYNSRNLAVLRMDNTESGRNIVSERNMNYCLHDMLRATNATQLEFHLLFNKNFKLEIDFVR